MEGRMSESTMTASEASAVNAMTKVLQEHLPGLRWTGPNAQEILLDCLNAALVAIDDLLPPVRR